MKILDKNMPVCNICSKGKMCQFINRQPDTRSRASLDLIHYDLAEPIHP